MDKTSDILWRRLSFSSTKVSQDQKEVHVYVMYLSKEGACRDKIQFRIR